MKVLQSIILFLLFFRPFIAGGVFEELDVVYAGGVTCLCGIYILIWAKPKRSPHDKFFVFFVLSLVIGFIFSFNYINGLKSLHKYFFLVTLFYFFYFEKEKNTHTRVLLMSGFFICLYALYLYAIISPYTLAYLRQQPVQSFFSEEYLLRKRAFAPFVLPSLLGGYLVMVIPICGGMVLSLIKKKKIGLDLAFYILCLAVSFFVLFLTKSVGAWFGLFGAFFLYAIFTKKRNKKFITFVLLILLVLVIVLVLRQQTNKEFIRPAFSLKMRLSYWRDTIKIIMAHPLKGVGLGNFSLKEARFAHNSYLQIWAEAGILGFVSWLAIVGLFFKEGIKRLRESSNNYLFSGFFIGGAGFLFHNLVDFSFFIPQVCFLWWIILATVLATERGHSLQPLDNQQVKIQGLDKRRGMR